ncbi:chitodextrinase/acyl-[acyl carrier protein]--UDP-N-acetylglucosamine O-acyltransferase [Clostridium beijerinckii]|uniref:fibronectin type III domain-containing protein n=1 Tax=Clostridium beijerinckii TaxID=1520 RepID=UPI001A9C1A2D|nr:fibronectin type III domain-containing protein [Clostridium beijerinckii]NRZ29585.1 chitodextrinase/acyl-[acyl carrier protein]--UDP-N-acetylglucosamine O-acyltransferase [Clostridium beijerinckii]
MNNLKLKIISCTLSFFMFFSLCGTSVNAIEYASSASNEIATTNSQITKNAAVDVTTSSEAVQNSLAEVTTGAAVTVDMQAPTVPTKLVASSITSTSCILSWTASTDNVGVTEYDIYSGTTKIGSTTGETTFEVTGLMPNTSYSFTIAAKDLAGNASEASGALSVTTIMNTEVTTGSAVTVDMQAPTVPTNLVSSSITSTSCILSWTASTDNIGVTEYDIYNGTTKIGSTTGETTYDVTGLMPNTSYSFTIVAKDLAGNTSEVSSILTIKTLSSSIIISSDLKLTKDIEYQDVEITSGEVDLNGHTMTINGNLIQSNGEVNIDGGQLIVNGDYRLQTKSNSNGTVSYDYGSGYLTMNKASDYVLVNGNFIDQSRYSGTLTAGILEVKGDFYEKVYYTYWGDYDGNFSASGSHKVILSGTGTQTVSFDNRGKSHFNILEISSSANSIKFATAIPLNKFEGDSKKVSNLNLYFCAPLSSDLTIENDLILSNGLDLNGHVLTVNNLVISGGTMQLNENNVNINGYFIINGGTVNLIGDSHINGDLNINGGEVDLKGHTMTINGNLIQSNGEVNIDGGQLIVNGDYRLQTKSNSNGTVSYDYGSGYLTMNKASDYVLVNGNFIDQSRYSGTLTAGTLEVKGDFYEKVYYTYWGDYDGNFSASGSHKVILSGTGTQTVSFDNRGKSHFNILEISSSANSIKFATAIPLNKFEGDSKKVSNLNLYFCAPLSSDLTIENDLILSNGLDLNGHVLTVNNLVVSGGTMQLNENNVNINGYFIINGGTVNLIGDSHINGDLNINGGEVDLNGHTMTINGNLIQSNGEVNIDGGQLIVNGDYRLQTKSNSNGTVSYDYGSGYLTMNKASDYVLVNGNFIDQSRYSGTLTAGTLEVKGDFYEKVYYTYWGDYDGNFSASGSHKVILSGSGTQTVSFDNRGKSHFNILEISSSANSIKFATAIPLNKFEGDSKKVSNLNLYFCAPLSSDLTIENDLILSNGLNFNGGNLNISRNLVISGGTIDLHGGNLNINGDLIISGGTFNLDGGRTNVNGNITQPGGELYVNGGQLTVNGDYRIQVKDDLNGTVCSEGSLKMDNAADYILVKKNFVIQSYNSSSSLTAGTLEVKGDFYQKKGFRYYFYGSSYCYNNFVASGSHKVILYGTASFENPDYSHFNILVNGKPVALQIVK